MRQIFLIVIGVYWGVAAGAGTVEFEQTELALGNVVAGSVHDMQFELYNRGVEPVAVERVWSGCGCAVARTESPVIAAGESLAVAVRFTAPIEPGGVSREVYVQLEGAALLVARFSAIVAAGGGREAVAGAADNADYASDRVLVRYRSDRCQLRHDLSRMERDHMSGEFACEEFSVLQEELNMAVLKLANGETVPEAVARLSAHPDVLYVQPDHRLGARASVPNDPSFSLQWNLHNTGQSGAVAGIDVGVLDAWDNTVGANTLIAILDSGVDYDHADMVGRMWDGSLCVDENGNFAGDCIHGWDYTGSEDSNPKPSGSNHGTHVAGIAGAASNNGNAVAGMAPGATVMAVRSASFTESELIQGIYFAKHNGAQVINASWGWSSSTCSGLMGGHQALYDACAAFPGLIAVAAGNGSRNHNGASWFDTADFGHFVRGTTAGSAMSIQQLIASNGAVAEIPFADSAHVLQITAAIPADQPFSVLLTAGSTTHATWVASARRLQVTYQQGVSAASAVVGAINGTQVAVHAAIGSGSASDALRLRLDAATDGGGAYKRATWMYTEPFDGDSVRLAIEALTDGPAGNGMTIRLRDTGGVVGDLATAQVVSDQLVEVDLDFGVSSSDTVADALNGVLSGAAIFRAWPALCFRPLDNVISVTSYDNRGTLLHDYGQNVDVAAPGKNIVSLNTVSGTTTKTGTSMASPHVAAAAAMVMSVKPNFTPGQVREAIKMHARCLPHGGHPLATSGNGYCAEGDAAQLDMGLLLSSLNAAPVAVDESYSLLEDGALSVVDGGLLDNDYDPDGVVTSAVLGVTPSDGAFSFNPDGTFSYVPDADFFGVDSFTYFASDGEVLSVAPATVTLIVEGVNDLPEVTDDLYTISEDGTLSVPAEGVLGNDQDVDSVMEAVIVVSALHGVVNLMANGSFTYVPVENFFGIDTFSYRVAEADGVEQSVDIGVVEITVEAVNDSPIVTDAVGPLEVQENASIDFQLFAQDVDDDGGDLDIFGRAADGAAFAAIGIGGLLTENGGLVQVLATNPNPQIGGSFGEIRAELRYYAPARDDCEVFRGADRFYLQVRDDGDGESQVMRVDVNVREREAPWYPRIEWSGHAGAWVEVSLLNAAQETAFVTRIRADKLLPQDYLDAGCRGLLPGEYSVSVVPWDPVNDILVPNRDIVIEPTTVEVFYQDAIGLCVPGEPIQSLGAGQYRVELAALGARGLDLLVQKVDTGTVRTVRHIAAPQASGLMLWENSILSNLALTEAGEYRIYARVFNALDENLGLPPLAEAGGLPLGRYYHELTHDPIVVEESVAGTRPKAPVVAQPISDDVFTLLDGESTRSQTLRWEPVAGATRYYAYLSRTAGAPVLNFVDVGEVTQLEVELSIGSYVFMVVAVNDHADDPVGIWSTASRFRIVDQLVDGMIDSVEYESEALLLSSVGGAGLPSRVQVQHYSDATGGGAWRILGNFDIVGGRIDLNESLPLGINYVRIAILGAEETPGPSDLFQFVIE